MGVADFYPFVLSVPAVRKLYLVHGVIRDAGARPQRQRGVSPAGAGPQDVSSSRGS